MEYIFVDDGSPDDSIYKLKKLINRHFAYRKPQIKIIGQENRGVPQTRKASLAHARGDYLLFVDADDWIQRDMVKTMAETAVRTRSDLVYCNFFREYGKVRFFSVEKSYRSKERMLRDLFIDRNFHGYLWNKMVRSSLFEDPRMIFPRYNMCEDLIITAQNELKQQNR